MEPGSYEASVNAVVNDADDLAEALYSALCAATSHTRTHPVVSPDDKDFRDVLIDGNFDLVALARHMREALRKDLLDLRKELSR